MFMACKRADHSAEPPCPIGRQEAEPGRVARDVEHHRQVLNELIDLGAEMARVVQRQAVAQLGAQADAAGADRAAAGPAGLEAERFAGAFERIARSVRRSIALARRLDSPVPAAAERAEAAAGRRRIWARKRIIREVEDTIQRTVDEREAEALNAELLERLDAADLDDDISNRPIEKIIADICRDFGMMAMPGTHPWRRRTPADVAELARVAARPPRPERAGGPPSYSYTLVGGRPPADRVGRFRGS